jgi:isopropylmalate/homocitrate/citramalate synthase
MLGCACIETSMRGTGSRAANAVLGGLGQMYKLCAEDMKIFYGLSKGAIEPIGILFSELAGSPMPPAVIMQVLTIISA